MSVMTHGRTYFAIHRQLSAAEAPAPAGGCRVTAEVCVVSTAVATMARLVAGRRRHLCPCSLPPASVAVTAPATAPERYLLSLAVGSVWDAVDEKPHKLRVIANLWTS